MVNYLTVYDQQIGKAATTAAARRQGKKRTRRLTVESPHGQLSKARHSGTTSTQRRTPLRSPREENVVKKRRSKAQKAATRKMIAANRRRTKGKRSKGKRRGRRNPILVTGKNLKVKKVRRRARVAAAAPKKRRKSRKGKRKMSARARARKGGDGPWDMTSLDAGDSADLFVTNVLNGTVAGGGKVVHGGTVTRLTLAGLTGKMPELQAITVIGSGFSERTDPAALVIGPTALGLSRNAKLLYVADSLNNRVAAIPNPVLRDTSAGTGATLTQGGSLNDPLGLMVGQDGNILTVNGDDGFLVATTPDGDQVYKTLLDSSGNPPGSGALFGLVQVPGQGLYYVDDATNTLNLFK